MAAKDFTVKINTRRFDFISEFICELECFSKKHQYDNIKIFKEAWKEWTEKDYIQKIILSETLRLRNSGYKGDINKKMFESARYYFRKKIKKGVVEEGDSICPIKRKDSLGVSKLSLQTLKDESACFPTATKRFSKIFLCEIDKNIVDQIKNNILTQKQNIKEFYENSSNGSPVLKSNISAAKMFDDFCKNNKELIQVEFVKILDKNVTKENISIQFNRLKKIYKNRLYNITLKLYPNKES